jgi:TolB-like protein
VQFVFGRYLLDCQRRELRRDNELRAIEPQVFDLLEFLLRNRSRVVGKDELFAAVWQGRIVSDATLASRINAVRTAIGDSGEDQRWIRTVPRRGVRFVGEVCESGETAPHIPDLSLPDRPSIAVLPFRTSAEAVDGGYFADGIMEEITTALSRLRWLFVIAWSSTLAYKGRSVDVKQVGRELGVRYVLGGSLRIFADRVRIVGELADTETGAQIWADRFEAAREDIFDLQDRVTESVVGAIAPRLEQVEIERSKRKPTDNLHAYDYYLRGLAGLHHGTRESTSDALQAFNRALELDPRFASAYGVAAFCYDLRKWNGWIVDPVHERNETARLASSAVEYGTEDAVALSAGGFALAHVLGQLDDGASCIRRALALNPNYAKAWHLGGWVAVWRGEPESAIDHVRRAIRLSPLDPLSFLAHGAISLAHFVAARYEDAGSWAEESVRIRPNFAPMLRLLASSRAQAGRIEEARKAIAAVRTLVPNCRIADIRATTPLRRTDDLLRYEDGLRKAGLGE